MVIVIVGLQYGSEGKGQVAASLAPWTTLGLRSGGPNAGHTVVTGEGAVVKLHHIPAAIIAPRALTALGPGGLVDPARLAMEISELRAAGIQVEGRFFIHEAAGVITAMHREAEREIQAAIGSTAQGVGEARRARISRLPRCGWIPAAQAPSLRPFLITDAEYMELLRAHERGVTVIEGTQGIGLSLIHGPWPHCTSADTTPGAVLGEVGIPPLRVTHVVGVVRTFPIRVGGDSGPLRHEVDWADIGREPELTTTTGRKRRIGLFEWPEFLRAVCLAGPDLLAVSFLDYLPGFPEAGCPLGTGVHEEMESCALLHAHTPIGQVVESLTSASGTRLVYAGCGRGTCCTAWRELVREKRR